MTVDQGVNAKIRRVVLGSIALTAIAVFSSACGSTHDGELGPETPTPMLAPVFETDASNPADSDD